MGCWFFVGPAMLSGAKGTALVATMPRERVLTEIDGPFGTASGRLLEPGDVALAEEALSNIWGCRPQEVRAALIAALRNLASVASGMGGPPPQSA